MPKRAILSQTGRHQHKKDYKLGKKVKDKAFALTQEETIENPNLMKGILLISELPAYVLIESRVTYSFISTTCIAKGCTACEKSNSFLEAIIISGITLNTN